MPMCGGPRWRRLSKPTGGTVDAVPRFFFDCHSLGDRETLGGERKEQQTMGSRKKLGEKREQRTPKERRSDNRGARRALARGSPNEAVTAFTDMTTRIALGDQVIALSTGELDRLLTGLGWLDLRGAATVGEQIVALRLVDGVIRMTLTKGELAAVALALAEEAEPLGPALLGLARLCADDAPTGGRPA